MCEFIKNLHFSEVHQSQLETVKLESGKMSNIHEKEIQRVKTACDNVVMELKVEHATMIEDQVRKNEEDRRDLLNDFGEERRRLEKKNQKLSALVDNFMTGSYGQDKFVKVSNKIIYLPMLLFSPFKLLGFEK